MLDIGQVTGADEAAVAERLPQRYARAQGFLHEEDRLRCIGAGVLLLHLGLRAEADLSYGPHGKPQVGYLPAFNLSHSGRYVACVTGNGPVGVDVEQVRPVNVKVAQRVLSAEELAWMQQAEAPEARFCLLWTCKEAVAKLFGEGLRMDPQGIGALALLCGNPVSVEGTAVYTRSLASSGYALTVASTEPLAALAPATVPAPPAGAAPGAPDASSWESFTMESSDMPPFSK